jgi:xylose isomerase
MDRDVMENSAEKFSVIVVVSDIVAVQDWCAENVPTDLHPNMTARETNNNLHVIRATFTSKHHAALFKLFWSGK